MKKSALLLLLALAAVAEAKRDVVKLTPANFDKKTSEGDWLIRFVETHR